MLDGTVDWMQVRNNISSHRNAVNTCELLQCLNCQVIIIVLTGDNEDMVIICELLDDLLFGSFRKRKVTIHFFDHTDIFSCLDMLTSRWIQWLAERRINMNRSTWFLHG